MEETTKLQQELAEKFKNYEYNSPKNLMAPPHLAITNVPAVPIPNHPHPLSSYLSHSSFSPQREEAPFKGQRHLTKEQRAQLNDWLDSHMPNLQKGNIPPVHNPPPSQLHSSQSPLPSPSPMIGLMSLPIAASGTSNVSAQIPTTPFAHAQQQSLQFHNSPSGMKSPNVREFASGPSNYLTAGRPPIHNSAAGKHPALLSPSSSSSPSMTSMSDHQWQSPSTSIDVEMAPTAENGKFL
jgi:hypothetical protein